MTIATDAQVQNYVNTRVRPHAEFTRALNLMLADDISAISDIYAALTQQSPTWQDNRTDGPPALLIPSDVLAFNAFMHDVQSFIANHAQYPIVLKACVRPVNA